MTTTKEPGAWSAAALRFFRLKPFPGTEEERHQALRDIYGEGWVHVVEAERNAARNAAARLRWRERTINELRWRASGRLCAACDAPCLGYVCDGCGRVSALRGRLCLRPGVAPRLWARLLDRRDEQPLPLP